MIIDCPHCGPRDHAEFTFGREAGAVRPADDTGWTDAWQAYVYERSSPRGVQAEYWQHTGGCRAWLRVERDLTSHAVLSTRLAP